MQSENASSPHIQATVQEVLPQLGLAYLADDNQRCWGVTRVTPGTGLDSLQAGQSVHVELRHVDSYTLVERYRALG